MAYVATQPLRWGDDTIPAGAPVPADEPGRDYAGMVHLGQIREVDEAGLSDEAVRAELRRVTAERDALRAQLEAAAGEEPEPVVIPDGVVPGETPGWPVVVLPLTGEQRELLAEGEVSGVVTIDELRETIDLLRDASARADAEAPGADGEPKEGSGELPEGVKDTGNGWFELPDGRKVRRRDIESALAESKA